MPTKVSLYRKLNPVDVTQLPAVQTWLNGGGDKEVSFNRIHVLLADNRVELAAIYGKRQGVFTTSFRFDIWNITHEGLSFWILSAKVKGTKIEVVSPDVWSPSDESRVVSFLDSLYQELKDFERSDE